jgi:hypothetical protein
MPRIRSIKPQFWLDEDLGNIQRDARLLYIGLWNLSDDTGVFEWRPKRIRIQLFPYDKDVEDDTIAKWLKLLLDTGDIVQFSTNGDSFGYIPSFLKHQDIQRPSKWHFAEIPSAILETHPPFTHNSLTNDKLFTNDSLTSNAREKEKEKEKEKIKVIGSREKESKYLAVFEEFKNELIKVYPDLDVANEIGKCARWWAEGKKLLKRPKTAINNWMEKAREIKTNGTHKPNNQRDGVAGGNTPNDYLGGKYGQFVHRD